MAVDAVEVEQHKLSLDEQVSKDPALAKWVSVIRRRHAAFQHALQDVCTADGSLHDFCVTNGLFYFGLQREKNGWRFREWAPCAVGASLVGDFNRWDSGAHPCERDDEGVFSVYIPDDERGQSQLRAGSRYKLCLSMIAFGEARSVLCVPAWAKCTSQDAITGEICAVVPLADVDAYCWQFERPKTPQSLRLYEIHPGIASSMPHVSDWTHLRKKVLPRIAELGYTGLLLLGVLEHGYYASFGYQVTSYFAPASRFGPAHELQRLIDEAHGLGLVVLVEMVHSHASSNAREGLPQDEVAGPYFLPGAAGHHAVWGSRIFDFSRLEVVRFLLANLIWWSTAYRVDGFRFDAASTTLYRHRCLGAAGSFSGDYERYFGSSAEVDEAGLIYLKLANYVAAHAAPLPLITIAEEHSGFPGLCVPVEEGGVGFSYRQAMAIPPVWTEVLSAAPDAKLELGRVIDAMCNCRADERLLAYCECHDQALMGAQSLAFRLMGDAMYTHMHVPVVEAQAAPRRACTPSTAEAPPLRRVRRGIALHKLCRLLTYTLGGDAYLNFIGNEWGHPEWIDMPSDANAHSFDKARRRWDLVDDGRLQYARLRAFDAAMHRLESAARWLSAPAPRALGRNVHLCEKRQLIWFARGGSLVVCNFDESESVDAFLDGCGLNATLKLCLSTDEDEFGGASRSTWTTPSASVECAEGASASGSRDHAFHVRLPPQAGCVFCPSDMFVDHSGGLPWT